MSIRRIIRQKDGINAYQKWRDQALSEDGAKPGVETFKAEPNLLPAPEPETTPELDAALAVLNNGGLTHLTAIQQKVFQLSVVEGMSNRDVAAKLNIGEKGVRQHLTLIGKKLRRLAVKHL